MPGISLLRSRVSSGGGGEIAAAALLGGAAVAVELRRALAQAIAAVRALGDVGADLGSAVLAHYEQVGTASAHEPIVEPLRRPAARPEARPAVYGRGRSDDLRHHLAEVVIGLIDHDLPGRAVATIKQVRDRPQLAGGAEVLAVLTHPIEDAPRQRPRRHPVRARQVDDLPLQAVAGGQPLVLVEHLPRVLRQPLAGVEVLGQLAHHRLHERGEPERVLDVRLGVHHPDLDRAEVRMGPDVVPQIGVVLDHAGPDHELDPALVVLPVVVSRGYPDAREGAEDRRPR